MSTARLFILSMINILVLGLLVSSSHAGSPPNSEPKTLKSLLDELDQKVEHADQQMIAHPSFIKDLRELIKKYRQGVRDVFLFEDFSDGNFNANPQWIVTSGQFHITPDKRLSSSIKAPQSQSADRPEKKEKDRKVSDREKIGVILNEILRVAGEKESSESPSPPASPESPAVIKTMTSIPFNFEIDMDFISKSRWGSTEIVLLGGKTGKPRYRLIYQARPSDERPIEIIRERNDRQYIIESATHYPYLDDGKIHRIQWIRNQQGRMKVLVDGKTVLSTVELFYKNNFAGLAFVNHGGRYEWGPIKIFQAPPKARTTQ